MSPTRREHPYPGFNFQVVVEEISNDGSSVSGAFTEVTGLEAEIKAIEYRAGNMGLMPFKDAGMVTYTNLTLKRGTTGDVEFWNWIANATIGIVTRTQGAITLHNENQDEVMRWNFFGAWPCKYTGPSFNAANNEIAMETVEICIERLEVDTGA